MSKKTYYITTPIYYPSGKLHIGHSYTTVAADAVARFKRLKGFDVMFLTGTDEHGQKIQIKAEQAGVTPKQYVDEIVSGIKSLWEKMNITNDRFIRTTDEHHVKAVQKIFKKLYDQGDIYKSEYEGMYCTPCESFWTESQLKDGCCPDCGRPVEKMKEESYFFRLSNYADRLVNYYEENPEFIQPNSRQNEMVNNFIKPGLEDLCVSRTSFNWGIPVEFDDKHVVYVWLDALSNYITALGYGSDDESDYKKYWPADVHLVGKEIVRFHTIIWPAMLMALGEPLPKQVFGHGWLLLDGGKISKSKENSKSSANIVDPEILIERYGLDAVRYFLLREVPFGSDGVFSNESLINRTNADLANDLGNLVSRTVSMIDKYFGGVIPENRQAGEFDDQLKAVVTQTISNVETYIDQMKLNLAVAEIWNPIKRANKYIDETMPWVLAKDEANLPRLAEVMYNLAETLRVVSILIEPFMPETPAKIQTQLGVYGNTEILSWEAAAKWGLYPNATQVAKGEIIFPRIDAEKELEELVEIGEANSSKAAEQENADGANVITIDEFFKVELKVAQVVEAEKVEKADKLLKLKLDIGTETRQVVSGIAKFYTPESIIGKKLVLVTNLKPAKLRGIESQGMILAASTDEKLSLITIDTDIENGSVVG